MPEDQYGNYQCVLTPAPPDNPSGFPIAGAGTTFINYAGPPVINPPFIANIIVDSEGQQWMFWGGEWH